MTNQATIDQYLQKVNKYVTLKSDDRKAYTQHYNSVLEDILNRMKKEDPLLCTAYNGHQLSGSYTHNLKVSTPNEFDTVFKIKFPVDYSKIKITKSPGKPAYVWINLKECDQFKLDKFKAKKIIDNDGYVLQDRVQAWIESILTSVLGRLQRKGSNFVYQIGGTSYLMTYKKCGPAHTFNVTVERTSINFSMDLVPTIEFDERHWIAKRKYPQDGATRWLAVPKPDKSQPGNQPNKSFITSYALLEKTYINDKNTLKNAIRLFKKMRDKNNLNNLKSYYIKTMFLWKVENNNNNMSRIEANKFWNQSLGQLMMTMFDELLTILSTKTLPFFWDKTYNMLSVYSDVQVKTMYDQINAIKNKLNKAAVARDSKAILSVFLDTDEATKAMSDLPRTP